MNRKGLLIILSLAVALTMALPRPALAAADGPREPDYDPLVLDVTPSSQSVTSADNYRAEWTVRISGGQGTYTLEVWFGDGGYLKRPGVAPGTYYYIWYYDNVTSGTYYQTWKIGGIGGPKYDYTSVYRAP